MQHVTSRHNPRLKEAARLVASARDRRKAGKCVLEGEHLVAVYAERYGAPESLVVAEDAIARPAIAALIERHADRAVVVPAKLFAELAVLPAGVGMLAVVAAPESPVGAPGDFCLLLDGIQDPGNVGSMLRTAAAAGVGDVLLSSHCAFAWSPKVLRAGQGAHFFLRIHEDVDLPVWAAAYRAGGGDVVATVAVGGASLFATPFAKCVAVAIGNEGAGLSPELAAAASVRVTIPMPGGTESLNAAAAAAICLYECVRQRGGPRSATG
ncbi:MAG: RNA methyltransferase [Betaproteobacteria bacterium]